jgi:phage-related protein
VSPPLSLSPQYSHRSNAVTELASASAPHASQIYNYMYISLDPPVIVSFVTAAMGIARPATIAWEGNSREVLGDFPARVKQNLGFELWQLQQGERPSDYRPLSSIGAGAFELRDQDERAWYRVIYLSRINDIIYVLHCFEKKGREMPKRDFDIARQRLRAVRARLSREKKHETRGQ